MMRWLFGARERCLLDIILRLAAELCADTIIKPGKGRIGEKEPIYERWEII
jgi:hypothetical protein